MSAVDVEHFSPDALAGVEEARTVGEGVVGEKGFVDHNADFVTVMRIRKVRGLNKG